MKKLFIANWKMNPPTIKEALILARVSDNKNVVVCPPFIFLNDVGKVLKMAALGAQDVFWEEGGAYTGEISPRQAKKLGASYVIIGHSERRQYLRETDKMIALKMKATIDVGLIPVLAVGENLNERKNNKTLKKIEQQILSDLALVKHQVVKNLIIAYEPIWAISTSQNSQIDDPNDSVKVINFIRGLLKKNKFRIKNLKFLYGGSINLKNISQFLKYNEIDGFLVGGASLRAKEMGQIIKKINNIDTNIRMNANETN